MAGIGAPLPGSSKKNGGKNAAMRVLDALGAPSRVVQNIAFAPLRELADTLDNDPTTQGSVSEMLATMFHAPGSQSAVFGDLVKTQPIFQRLPPELKILGTLGSDILLDPLNYLGVGLITKPAGVLRAASAADEVVDVVTTGSKVADLLKSGAPALGRDWRTAAEADDLARMTSELKRALEAGAEAGKTADILNTVKGSSAATNALNEAADGARTVSRVGQRVNAKRIQADILSTNVVNIADRSTEAGQLYRGGVASLLPETQKAIGYQSNLVFKIPFTESAVAIPGTEKIGAFISVKGGRIFKGGFNALVTSLDPKYWIGEEAMYMRMAAKSDLAESIPQGMVRYYQMADGSWTTSKYKAVKDLTDVAAGLRVADVPESAVASSGWAEKLADVSGMSDVEAGNVLSGVNIHRVEIPYELPKAFAAVQARRLYRAIEAQQAGQVLHDAIVTGAEKYGIKDVRFSLNQMNDLGAAVWLDPNSKFREVIVDALFQTHQRLIGKGGENWRVPMDIADQWLADTINVLDEHANKLQDLVTDPAKFLEERKKGKIGLVNALVEQGKKAGQIQAAIAVDGSFAEAARLSQGILRTDITAERSDALASLVDDFIKAAEERGLDVGPLKESRAAAKGRTVPAKRGAKPRTVSEQIGDLFDEAKTGVSRRNMSEKSDIVARYLTGDMTLPQVRKALVEKLGMDSTIVDDLLKPFSGKSAADLRKLIDQKIAASAGKASTAAKIADRAVSADDAVRFWEHILTNGWDELFDGSVPQDWIAGLLEGSGVNPAKWLELSADPVIADADALLRAGMPVTVTAADGTVQALRPMRTLADVKASAAEVAAHQLAPQFEGAMSAAEYAANRTATLTDNVRVASERKRTAVSRLWEENISEVEAAVEAARTNLENAEQQRVALQDLVARRAAEGRSASDPDLLNQLASDLPEEFQRHLDVMGQAGISPADPRFAQAWEARVSSVLRSGEGGVAAAQAQFDAAMAEKNRIWDLFESELVAADEVAKSATDIPPMRVLEREYQIAFEKEVIKQEASLTKNFKAWQQRAKNKAAEIAVRNQKAVDGLRQAQENMVNKVLGNYRQKALTANEKLADLARQHNELQTELGQLMAMETSLNNAAFAIGDQVDKFTAYLYRDIQAQHVDLLNRAQDLGVSLNTAGDADVVFMDVALRVAQMNEREGAKMLGFATVGEGGNIKLPSEMAKFITADQHAGEFSKVTRLWRSLAIMRPGFSNRNFIGAWINNVSQGIRYGDYEAAAFLAQAMKKNKDLASIAAKYKVDPNDIREAYTILVSNSQLVGEAAHGLHAGTRTGNMIERGSLFMERYSIVKNGYLGSRRSARAAGITEAAKDITVEDSVRLAQYIGLRRQGITHTAAMGQTLGTHFNYLDTSILDARIKKYVPFWTYQSRNLGLQAQLILAHPETTKAFFMAREDLREDASGRNLPPWLGGFALPYGNTVLDFSGYVPAGDLIRTGDFISRFPSTPDKSVFGLASQMLGGPQYTAAQLLMNRDLFRGGSPVYQPSTAAGDVASYVFRSVGPVQQSLSMWDILSSGKDPYSLTSSVATSLGLLPSRKEYTPQ